MTLWDQNYYFSKSRVTFYNWVQLLKVVVLFTITRVFINHDRIFQWSHDTFPDLEIFNFQEHFLRLTFRSHRTFHFFGQPFFTFDRRHFFIGYSIFFLILVKPLTIAWALFYFFGLPHFFLDRLVAFLSRSRFNFLFLCQLHFHRSR